MKSAIRNDVGGGVRLDQQEEWVLPPARPSLLALPVMGEEDRLLVGLVMARRVIDHYLARRNAPGVRRMRRLEDRILRDLLALYARELDFAVPVALAAEAGIGQTDNSH